MTDYITTSPATGAIGICAAADDPATLTAWNAPTEDLTEDALLRALVDIQRFKADRTVVLNQRHVVDTSPPTGLPSRE